MPGVTNYSLVQSVSLASLLAAIAGVGITIVPGSGSITGDPRAFGIATSPKDIAQSPNFMEIPVGSGAAAAMGSPVVVLSTGQVVTLHGPNNSPSAGTDFGRPGDALLAALIGTPVGNTFDAAILTFRFIPSGTSVTLPYLFGSEEYTEFVYDVYTDVMGIWVDGVQLAVVPGTATPIAINTVHHGDPDGTPPFANPQYYTNNEVSTGPINAQVDGFVGLNPAGTLPMRITIPTVIGQSYLLRIGVCDVSDGVYDSAIWLGQLTASGIQGVGCSAGLPMATGAAGNGCSAGLPPTPVSY